MGKTVGSLIKQARTAAKLTQEKLAVQIKGMTATDISKAERGDIDLSQTQLKAIAKITGVTQASLLNAAKEEAEAAAKKTTAKTTAAKTSTTKTSTAKTSAAKTSTAKTSTAKTSTAKTTSDKAPVPAGATISMKVTAAEQKLIEAYRLASASDKKDALKVLKDQVEVQGADNSSVVNMITDALSGILGGK